MVGSCANKQVNIKIKICTGQSWSLEGELIQLGGGQGGVPWVFINENLLSKYTEEGDIQKKGDMKGTPLGNLKEFGASRT